MANRKYGNQMERRSYISLTARTYDMLCNSKTFHIDAWIYQTVNDELYLLVETRAGGSHLISRSMARVQPDGFYPVADDPELEHANVMRHIDSPWARRNAPWLSSLHDKLVLPEIRMPRAGFERLSVKLWYVWTDPTINEPCEGITNLYAVTGRAGRDAARMIERPRDNGKVRTYNADERSQLRTLDKLLKPLSDKTD